MVLYFGDDSFWFWTLQYANTAKSIENKPEVNQRMTKRALLKDYCVEMDRLRQDLVSVHSAGSPLVATTVVLCMGQMD